MKKLRTRISQLFVVILLALILVSDNAWEYNAPFLCAVLFLIGTVLVGIASIGRLWCSIYIAGYKTQKLITEGPYSICRNPLYFFSLLGAVGVGFATETLLIPFIILIAFSMYYPSVIKSEEMELRKIHKDEFEEYRNNVPAFFPKISLLKEPEKYTMNPIVFKKHMLDALWFIWLLGILEIIETLHDLKLLPKLFIIY
ncbi:MAG: isoprenylcysteine carboxylmethyltransferase family protein [Syntrophaceae bacterium]